MSEERDKIRELENELERARQLVFQSAKLAEMGKMVAVVAHELSQPLLGIKAFAQILRRRFQDDEFIEPKVRMIEEQAVHMESILGSLRRYSKLPDATKRHCNPSEAVHAATELYQERARKMRIRVLVEEPAGLPPVRISHGHLQQVTVNLLSNALDALEGPGEGLVVLRIESDGDRVRLRVADNGGGVGAAARANLFEPFFTTKGSEKGTGLGLSICRDILRQYNGSIRLMEPDEVEEAFGSDFGASFEVELGRAGQGQADSGQT